jgi:hypothetical protein
MHDGRRQRAVLLEGGSRAEVNDGFHAGYGPLEALGALQVSVNQLSVELPQEQAALGSTDQQAGSKAAGSQKPCHLVADEASGPGHENAHGNLVVLPRRTARLPSRSITGIASWWSLWEYTVPP